ncbi:DUF1893 domain-containing protein [Anaerosphaera multitolerans]|uniref:DUF1893 domain-containing protein n=1 Tax=Anaerosphaera multitolerans TaxID=2487351 RepID=A0A437S8S4_9FIRM|nr:DUF1893 domain-containing protein [Anaerosphaera multitolerans]RVU55505.1 DUF1893 domain-containing protein [Anaerosphaera multitolerans]
MRDICLAKKIFKNENLSLVVVKNGKVLFKSKDRGIKPLYLAVTERREVLEGASVVDKVIGKAAAMLCVYGKFHEIHTEVISKEAKEILRENEIKHTYEELTFRIMNRSGADLCPMEKISMKLNDVEKLLNEIDMFLKNSS